MLMRMDAVVSNDFMKFHHNLLDNLELVVIDYTNKVAQKAAADAPKDTGFMAAAIYAVTTRGSDRQPSMKAAKKLAPRRFLRAPNTSDVAIKGRPGTRYSGYVIAGAPYTIHVEFGTHKMAARPFFFPAAEFYRSAFIADVAKALVKP